MKKIQDKYEIKEEKNFGDLSKKGREKLHNLMFKGEKQLFFVEEEILEFADWIDKNGYIKLDDIIWVIIETTKDDIIPKTIAKNTKELLQKWLKSRENVRK